METAEQIVRRKAREGEWFFVGIKGKNPPSTQTTIGNCVMEEYEILKAKYGGTILASDKQIKGTGEFRWFLFYYEPRRLQSLFEIIPLLKGTNKYRYAMEALCEELSIPLQAMHNYLGSKCNDRAWSWHEDRKFIKLFYKGSGED